MSEDRLIDVNKVLSKKAKGKKVPGFLVSLIKRFIHQDFLNSIIAKSGDGVDFCTDTIRELNVQLTVRGLENVPDDGTLYTFASNHPLGGVDGVALASIVGQKFGDVRLLMLSMRNSLKRCRTNVSGRIYFCIKSLVTMVS